MYHVTKFSVYYFYSKMSSFTPLLSIRIVLAPVVKTLDSAIHWINHYPVDKYWGN